MVFNILLSCLGVLVAFPMKRRFINDEQHPFPEGRACGVVLDALYHGADADNCYCLGALLLDLEQPWIVLARSTAPLMAPTEAYEKTGFFGNVIFTNGHLVDGDAITMYYGASDEVICGATLSIESILAGLRLAA